ncbi:uncharacterized protein KY384_005249 [Bacidia gigantensis]|uniref:uncharacterized protein n=1 Tax=Bacidia gigantensis TaxID=2732470 RepID=UPI001D036757|nr:uncharacterized protein KY384_005249 [Bacidia gigantensis]KAG8529768.1 hypothetical protein KY384_005249 [Bacidia gigantensis]
MAFPRNSLRAFLGHVKPRLWHHVEAGLNINIVVGNQSAASVLYSYIRSISPPQNAHSPVYVPLLNLQKSGLRLRPEFNVVCQHAGIEPSALLTLEDLPETAIESEYVHWILVDHNKPTGSLETIPSGKFEGVIDHHEDESFIPSSCKCEPRIVEKAGSCTSLVTRYFRSAWDAISNDDLSTGAAHGQGETAINDRAFTRGWDAQLAKMALASILIDTVDLTASGKVEAADREAVDYLEARINLSPLAAKSWDRKAFFSEVNGAKSNIGGLSFGEVLIKDYKHWTVGRSDIGIGSVVKDLGFLQHKAEQERGVRSDQGPSFPKALDFFMEKNQLHVFAVMTAFTEDNTFQRQLLLQADLKIEGMKEKIEGFSQKAARELNLEVLKLDCFQASVSDNIWRKAWSQKDLSKSRKKVAPMLRAAME